MYIKLYRLTIESHDIVYSIVVTQTHFSDVVIQEASLSMKYFLNRGRRTCISKFNEYWLFRCASACRNEMLMPEAK